MVVSVGAVKHSHRGASSSASCINIKAERGSRRRGVCCLDSVAVATVAGLKQLAQAATAGAEYKLLTFHKVCIPDFHTQVSGLQQAAIANHLICRRGQVRCAKQRSKQLS